MTTRDDVLSEREIAELEKDWKVQRHGTRAVLDADESLTVLLASHRTLQHQLAASAREAERLQHEASYQKRKADRLGLIISLGSEEEADRYIAWEAQPNPEPPRPRTALAAKEPQS